MPSPPHPIPSWACSPDPALASALALLPPPSVGARPLCAPPTPPRHSLLGQIRLSLQLSGFGIPSGPVTLLGLLSLCFTDTGATSAPPDLHPGPPHPSSSPLEHRHRLFSATEAEDPGAGIQRGLSPPLFPAGSQAVSTVATSTAPTSTASTTTASTPSATTRYVPWALTLLPQAGTAAEEPPGSRTGLQGSARATRT